MPDSRRVMPVVRQTASLVAGFILFCWYSPDIAFAQSADPFTLDGTRLFSSSAARPPAQITNNIGRSIVMIRFNPSGTRTRYLLRDSIIVNIPVGAAGFYDLKAWVAYDEQDLNETFYTKVRNGKLPPSPPDTSNAPGGLFVVLDDESLSTGGADAGFVRGDTTSLSTIDFDSLIVRDAGNFFFAEGRNTVIIHHLQDMSISDGFPIPDSLVNGPFIGFESVKIYRLRIERTDLAIAKTMAPGSLFSGEPFSSELTISNLGTAEVTAYTVVDTLPDGVDPASLSNFVPRPPDIINGQVLTWNLTEELAAGGTATISYTATCPTPPGGEPQTLTNIASVAVTNDADPSNNRATASITCLPRPDLVIEKTAAPLVLQRDDTLTYRLVIRNQGPGVAATYTVADTLPDQINPANILAWSPRPPDAISGNELTWNFTSLAAGDSTVITFSLLCDQSGLHFNRAGVTTPGDSDTSNNTANVTVECPPAYNLWLNKSPSTGSVVSGEPFSWRIRISNEGPDTAATYTVMDTLPDVIDPSTLTDFTPRPPDNINGNILTWNFTDLVPGDTTLIRFVAVCPAPDTLINRAGVTAPFDSDPSDNTDATILICTQPPVIVTKAADTDTAMVGDTLRYTITVRNGGNAPALDVNVTDTLPVLITPGDLRNFAPRAPDAITGSVISWTVPTLAAGDSIIFSYEATVPAGTVRPFDLTNTAAADTSSSTTVVTVRDPEVDLGITKTPADTSLDEGQPFTWTLTVTNSGRDNAAAFTVSDTLPDGFDPATLTNFVPRAPDTIVGQVLTWNLSDLGSGESTVISFDAICPGENVYVNRAEVTAPFDTNPDNDRASATVQCTTPPILVTKTADADTVLAGDTLRYVIRIVNGGTSPALNVLVTDDLPALISADSLRNFAPRAPDAIDGSVISWTVPTLAAGDSIIFSYEATVPAGTVRPFDLTNTAAADTSTSTAVVTVRDPEVDLGITKTPADTSLDEGQPFTWTLTVTNSGRDNAAAFTVSDTLPDGFDPATLSNFVPRAPDAIVGQVLTWNLSDLGSGESTVISFDAICPGEDVYVNRAEVSAPFDTNPDNDRASATVQCTTPPILVTKTADADTVLAGDTLRYVIRIVNGGTSPALNVLVTDDLPALISADSLRNFAPRAPDAIDGSVISWTVPTLAAGDSIIFSYEATVPAGTVRPFDLTNTAAADTSSSTTVVTVRDPEVDLGITKTPADTTLDEGQPFTWTLTVTNSGRDNAAVYTVSDTLPDGFNPATLSNYVPRAPDAIVGQVLTWNLSDLGSGESTVISFDAICPGEDVYVNRAEVSAPFDTNPDNDRASATVQCTTPPILVTKTADADTVLAGDTLRYVIRIVNGGTSPALNVLVTDDLPALISADSLRNFAPRAPDAIDGSVISWTVPTLAAGDSIIFSYEATVPAGTVRPFDLTNTAAADTSSSTTVVTVRDPEVDLGITKTPADTTLDEGQPFTWTLTVTNSGRDNAAVYTVSDTLPDGFNPATLSNYVPRAPDAIVGQVLTWNLSDLGSGESTVISFDAICPGEDVYVNRAEVSAPFDTNPDNDRASATVQCTTPPILVTKTADADTVLAGDTLRYVIRIVNGGTSPALNVLVTDDLPALISADSLRNFAPRAPDAIDGSVISWTVPTLAAGDSIIFSYEATVPTGTVRPFDLTNTAAADTSTSTAVVTVRDPEVDLGITKTPADTTLDEGQPFTWTLTVTNSGRDNAAVYTVSDTLPDGFNPATLSNYVPRAPDAIVGQVLTWNLTDLGSGESTVISFDTTCPDSGVFVNRAEVSAPFDSNPDNDRASATVSCTRPPIFVTKTADADTVLAGDTLRYVIRVLNSGSSPALNLVVTDMLPDLISPDSLRNFAPRAPDAIDGSVISWTVPTLAAGDSIIFSYEATVPAGTVRPFDLTNTAAADTSTSTAVVTVRDPEVDLGITKTPADTTLDEGQPFTWTLTVTNSGRDNAAVYTVSDTLPDGFNPATLSNYVPRAPDAIVGQVLTWNLTDLGSGESTVISFDTTCPDSGVFVNRAEVSAPFDSNPDNDRASATVSCTRPPIFVTKTADADTVLAGDTLRYVIRVLNSGSSPALNLVVTDMLPDLISPDSLRNFAPRAPDAIDGSVISWTVPTLAAGDSIIFSYEATAPAGTVRPFDLTNTAAADTSTSTAVVTVRDPEVDLGITKTPADTTLDEGQPFTWTLTVTNSGRDNAAVYTVSDTLPDGFNPATLSNYVPKAPDAIVGQVLTWNLSDLGSGESTIISFDATCPDSGVFVNRAEVSAPFDTNPGNDRASATVRCTTPPPLDCDVQIEKTANADSLLPGQLLSYTITLTNIGSDSCGDLTVEDILPDALSAAALSNFVPRAPDEVTGQVLTWNLGPLAADSSFVITFDAVCPAADTLTTLVNTARVETAVDQDTTNNTASVGVVCLPPPPAYDLRIEKRASVDSAGAGQTFRYTIVVTNDGPATVPVFTIRDDLPSALRGADLSNFSRDPDMPVGAATTMLEWTIQGPLAPGGSVTISFDAVCPSQGATLVNAAEVMAEADTNPANNRATATVICQPPPPCVSDCSLDRNVFNVTQDGMMRLDFTICEATDVKVDLHDMAGTFITNIIDQPYAAGTYSHAWNGRRTEDGADVGAGFHVFVLRFSDSNGERVIVKRIIIVR